ncbi:class I SAM-dependent methyltransferase [Streptomyces sp. NPDC047017]|uniref:class I SAM-dependent methyltransferase n=1 Tax=Streptomyces sp. NPDC047017 TaxID=3155024 RepID=UPI0033E3CED7
MNSVTFLKERYRPDYWDSLYRAGFQVEPPSEFERQMLRAYTGATSGMRAIDVGCGRGHLSAHLASWGLSVTGYDFSRVAIEEARTAHSDLADLLDFRVHDFDTGRPPADLEPGSVDIVVARLSLEFMDWVHLLARARHWLAPNGLVHISTHVTDLIPPACEHSGLREAQIESLRDDWNVTTYGLDGYGGFVGLVLRDGPLLR